MADHRNRGPLAGPAKVEKMTKDSRKPVLAAMTVLALAAVACAGWYGWSWLSAAHSGSLSEARTRDVVLQQAEQGVLNFNTLNYHQAARGLQVWLASSTGELHSELSQNLSQEVQLVEQRKTITTARILDGAVTQLATGPGTATVMVGVEVTVTPAKGSPVVESESEVGQLARTGSGWKLSALGYPPGTSGASPSPSPSSSASP
jgi:Mce-associated membrane protein